jgi:hypothetical protein
VVESGLVCTGGDEICLTDVAAGGCAVAGVTVAAGLRRGDVDAGGGINSASLEVDGVGAGVVDEE